MSSAVKWAIVLLVLLLILAGALLWMCREDLIRCRCELEHCGGDCEAVEFSLIVHNDAYGTFQPLNNQVRDQPEPPYRSGIFFQIGDFLPPLGHQFESIELYTTNGVKQILGRDTAKWIDVICGDTTPPLEADRAQSFVPDPADPDTHHRLLHFAMHYDPMVLITMWDTEQGLRAHTEPFGKPTGGDHEHAAGETGSEPDTHGHVRYVWNSPEPCAVRVFEDWSAPSDEYPATGPDRIVRIEVLPAEFPTKHGGTHMPPWSFAKS